MQENHDFHVTISPINGESNTILVCIPLILARKFFSNVTSCGIKERQVVGAKVALFIDTKPDDESDEEKTNKLSSLVKNFCAQEEIDCTIDDGKFASNLAA